MKIEDFRKYINELIEKYHSALSVENTSCDPDAKKLFQTTHKIWFDSELEDNVILSEVLNKFDIQSSSPAEYWGVSDQEIIVSLYKRIDNNKINTQT